MRQPLGCAPSLAHGLTITIGTLMPSPAGARIQAFFISPDHDAEWCRPQAIRTFDGGSESGARL
jgi:hypothetical protein